MKKFIYLAGPVAGCDKKEAKDWRTWVINHLKPNIVGISPLRCEPLIGQKYELQYNDLKFGTPKAISGKNYLDTVTCDAILAYLPKELNEKRPSYGTILEIGWAIGLRKPIILITDDDYLRKHPLIEANVNWILDNFDDALDVIHGLFEIYVQN